jgi:CRISPR-associated protein Csx3
LRIWWSFSNLNLMERIQDDGPFKRYQTPLPADIIKGIMKPSTSVLYPIGVSAPITPAEPLPPLPEIPRGSLVIVEGRAPIWRYGMALHLLHGSPAAAIAFYDPRLGAVVVASHSREWTVGDVIDITLRDNSTSAEVLASRTPLIREPSVPH